MLSHLWKTTNNIIPKGERLKDSPTRSRIRQGCLFPLLLLNIVLEVLVRLLRQEKEIRGIQTGRKKKKVKWSLSPFMMTLFYVQNFPKNPQET